VPPRTSMALLKNLLLLVVRPLAGRQSAYNARNANAVEALLNELNAQHSRVAGLQEDFEAYLAEVAAREDDLSEVNDAIHETRDHVDATRSQVDHALADALEELARVRE